MKKRWISGLLVIAMLLTMMPVWEVAAEETESIVSLAGEGAVIADGTCGDNLTWTLTEDGVLTISGTGGMEHYYGSNTPWYAWRERIYAVVFEDGVTSIGEDAFYGCAMLTTVTVSETLTQVHYDAFTGCNRLTYAYYDNAKYWGTSDNPYYLLVEAVSATALTMDQLERLTKKLIAITGKQIELRSRVDPNCLGGIRLDYDGKQLDDTLQHRLDDIGKLLKNTAL